MYTQCYNFDFYTELIKVVDYKSKMFVYYYTTVLHLWSDYHRTIKVVAPGIGGRKRSNNCQPKADPPACR